MFRAVSDLLTLFFALIFIAAVVQIVMELWPLLLALAVIGIGLWWANRADLFAFLRPAEKPFWAESSQERLQLQADSYRRARDRGDAMYRHLRWAEFGDGKRRLFWRRSLAKRIHQHIVNTPRLAQKDWSRDREMLFMQWELYLRTGQTPEQGSARAIEDPAGARVGVPRFL